MSAIANLPVSASASVTQLPFEAGAAEGFDLADPGLSGSGQGGSFAALFQELAARKLIPLSGPDLDKAAMAAQDALAAVSPDESVSEDVLAALLPFLEGMGMVPVSEVAPALHPAQANNAAITAVATTPAGNGATLPYGAMPDTADDKALPPALLASLKSGAAPGQSGKPAVEPLTQGGQFAAALQAATDKGSGQQPLPAMQGMSGMGAQLSQTQGGTTALPVAHPVNSPGWGQEVGNRIVWMATRLESRAELVLTPPHMGRVEVNLSVNGDQASASFVSANPAVREALEAALPRLREILAEAGIQLGQAQVGAEHAGQQGKDKEGDNAQADASARTGDTASSLADGKAAAALTLKSGRGLVDVFA